MRGRLRPLMLAAVALGGCTTAAGAPASNAPRAGRSTPAPAGATDTPVHSTSATPDALAVTPAAAPPTTASPAPPARTTPVAVRNATGEVLPEAKQIATDVALRLTTYGPATALSDVVAPITPDPEGRRALEASAAPLHHPGSASTGTVLYAQLGGFRAERSSVMVVVRQDIGPDAAGRGARSETRTLDVRLARTAGRWTYEGVASVGGNPVARPAGLSPAAAAVVDNPRIQLPDSARWDIYRGAVSPSLLTLLAATAQQVPIAVTVLESGHPHDVFGTGRTSNHTRGRAADVYRVGDLKVIDGRSAGSPVEAAARWLQARPDVSEFGSPWRLGPDSFTDIVHQDHFHIAVRG